ncbi:MAG: hypothetical protein NVV62_14220 [Terricaulis sp.]|nr:hypothetical protein [Terricaulis sp.]
MIKQMDYLALVVGSDRQLTQMQINEPRAAVYLHPRPDAQRVHPPAKAGTSRSGVCGQAGLSSAAR